MMSYTNRRADIKSLALRTAFFLIAFVPLWLILSINCWAAGTCHYGLTIGGIVCIVVLLLGTRYYMKKWSSRKESRYFKVEKKDDITLNMAFYILAYIPALFVESFEPVELIAFTILLFTVYLVYVKANMLHVNPVLTVMGYKTYRATDDHFNTVVLLSRLNVRTGTEVEYVEITPNINLVLEQQ